MDVEYCAGTVVCIQLGDHKIDALFHPATDPGLYRQDTPPCCACTEIWAISSMRQSTSCRKHWPSGATLR